MLIFQLTAEATLTICILSGSICELQKCEFSDSKVIFLLGYRCQCQLKFPSVESIFALLIRKCLVSSWCDVNTKRSSSAFPSTHAFNENCTYLKFQRLGDFLHLVCLNEKNPEKVCKKLKRSRQRVSHNRQISWQEIWYLHIPGEGKKRVKIIGDQFLFFCVPRSLCSNDLCFIDASSSLTRETGRQMVAELSFTWAVDLSQWHLTDPLSSQV